jgi:hypothetical protein
VVLLPRGQNPIPFSGQLHRCPNRFTAPEGETVEVQFMAPEDACSAGMLKLIRWHGRTVAVPLSQQVAIDPDQSAAEAIGDWHYWVAQGYCF